MIGTLSPARQVEMLNTELLVDTVQRLSLARDIQEVMRIVRTVARKLTGADGATFVLRDGDRCYYADEDAISPLWKGSRFPMSQCISGWVMNNRTSVVIKDIYADERIPADAYRPTFVKSLAMVPIRTMEPLGAIGNYWAVHRQPTEAEVTMLQALADITAVSIENIEVRNNLEQKVSERTHELADALSREKEIHAMKSTFVAMASHELRTPLSTIRSSAEIAGKYTQPEEQEKRDKHLARIRASVDGLVHLLDDFLSIGKIEEGGLHVESERFDLPEFLRDIVAGLDGVKKREQHIHIACSGEREVQLDRKILRNILLNLLSNAIKYSEKAIELDAHAHKDELRMTITDHGIGIPAEQQRDLFSRFFRASNASGVQGTGLGLHIVKHYVDLLNGTISFHSAEGQGTSFTIVLPLH